MTAVLPATPAAKSPPGDPSAAVPARSTKAAAKGGAGSRPRPGVGVGVPHFRGLRTPACKDTRMSGECGRPRGNGQRRAGRTGHGSEGRESGPRPRSLRAAPCAPPRPEDPLPQQQKAGPGLTAVPAATHASEEREIKIWQQDKRRETVG